MSLLLPTPFAPTTVMVREDGDCKGQIITIRQSLIHKKAISPDEASDNE
jgi:hypothetical protein